MPRSKRLILGIVAAGALAASVLAAAGCGSGGGSVPVNGTTTEDVIFAGTLSSIDNHSTSSTLITAPDGVPTGQATPPGNGTGLSIMDSSAAGPGGTVAASITDPPQGGHVLFGISGRSDYLSFPVPPFGAGSTYEALLSVSMSAPRGQYTIEYVTEDSAGNYSRPTFTQIDLL